MIKYSILLVVGSVLLGSTSFVNASELLLQERVSGRILLQVQNHGEAWYVSPTDGARYYMKDGPTAYEMMRYFGLGISETDFLKLEAGDASLTQRLLGRIVLRVLAHGEAYYIHPNGTIHYLQNGAAAYLVMRNLSLGITNSDLEKIQEMEMPTEVLERLSPPETGSNPVEVVPSPTPIADTSPQDEEEPVAEAPAPDDSGSQVTERQLSIRFDTNDAFSSGQANKCDISSEGLDAADDGYLPIDSQNSWPTSSVLATLDLKRIDTGGFPDSEKLIIKSITVENSGTSDFNAIDLQAYTHEIPFTVQSRSPSSASFVNGSNQNDFGLHLTFNPNNVAVGQTLGVKIVAIEFGSTDTNIKYSLAAQLPIIAETPSLFTACTFVPTEDRTL